MSVPQVEITPLRPAIHSDQPTTLDVLIAITPPQDLRSNRPPLNIGLVLDRSGSMCEAGKMPFAQQAAVFLVSQLRQTDHFSLTLFDEIVETIVPNRPVQDRAAIISLINAVQPRGSTDLFAGWQEGGRQVREHRLKGGINRVILLSDGQANHGVQDPNEMGIAARALNQEGVSTTTMGVGVSYNEDLLEKIAENGDGNYHYISNPVQLTDIFQTELKELVALCGTNVTLRATFPEGATNTEILNDFVKLPDASWQLPNLIGGLTTKVVLRFTLPAMPAETEVLRFELSWDKPGQSTRQSLELGLTLPAITAEDCGKLAEDVNVAEHVAVLQIARLKREAMTHLDRHDIQGTEIALVGMRMELTKMRPDTPLEADSAHAIGELEDLFGAGKMGMLRKAASAQSNLERRSKPTPEQP